MTKQGFFASRALCAASLTLAIAGCDLGTNAGGPIPPTRITKLQAYYCAVRNEEICVSRGDSIPAGTLPPTNEAFQVWVWHPGSNTTEWRFLSSLDAVTLNKVRYDSAGESFLLNGAPAKDYTVRVLIKGPTTYLAEDSLRWTFP